MFKDVVKFEYYESWSPEYARGISTDIRVKKLSNSAYSVCCVSIPPYRTFECITYLGNITKWLPGKSFEADFLLKIIWYVHRVHKNFLNVLLETKMIYQWYNINSMILDYLITFRFFIPGSDNWYKIITWFNKSNNMLFENVMNLMGAKCLSFSQYFNIISQSKIYFIKIP